MPSFEVYQGRERVSFQPIPGRSPIGRIEAPEGSKVGAGTSNALYLIMAADGLGDFPPQADGEAPKLVYLSAQWARQLGMEGKYGLSWHDAIGERLGSAVQRERSEA
jgi:hypothetical protein